MTLIVYIETEEFELESTNDDDEDDETAADDETADDDDDDDDGNEDDCANGSIHKSPGAYNLKTTSSLNDLGQSMRDLSPSATASGNKSNDDDEHKNTNSNGSDLIQARNDDGYLRFLWCHFGGLKGKKVHFLPFCKSNLKVILKLIGMSPCIPLICNMSLHLFFRESGTGNPLVILHGVFGSGDNWLTVSKLFTPF
jgi:hypothetical protein